MVSWSERDIQYTVHVMNVHVCVEQQADQHRDRAAERSRRRGGDQVEDRSDSHQEEAADPHHGVGVVSGRSQQEQHRAAEDHQEAVPHTHCKS